jgi:hypothetical protein
VNGVVCKAVRLKPCISKTKCGAVDASQIVKISPARARAGAETDSPLRVQLEPPMPRPLGLRLRAAVRRFWFLTQRRLMRFAAGGSTSPSVLRRHAPALEPRSSTLWASSAGGGGHTRAPSGSSGAAVGPLSASLVARCASYEPRLASRVASAPAHLRSRTSSCQCIPFACARTGRFAASGGGVSLCADLDADGRGVRGGWLAPELAPGPALGVVVIGGVEGRRFRSDFSSDFRSCRSSVSAATCM